MSSDQRRLAKTSTFGLIYGMSPFGLARQLGIERGCGAEIRRCVLRALSGREALHGRHARAGALDDGFVETVYGRRLYLPDIRASNAQLRQAAERSAINAPMQGTAADIIKRAMIGVDAWCRRENVAGARSSCRCMTSSCSRCAKRPRRK